MHAAIRKLAPALAPLLLLCPAAAQAQRSCISDAEIEAVLGPQVRSGAMLIDASKIDNGRPLCTGGTIARRIHRLREEYRPEERDARLAREERERADIARIAVAEEAARDRRNEAERLETLARIAAARRDAAEANAGEREAALRAARAERTLAALPPAQYAEATILLSDSDELNAKLENLVLQDSEHWLVNRYEPRSMHDASFVRITRPGSDYEAMGRFRYAGGGTGWVSARFLGGELACLEYHNQPGVCRELGNSLSYQNLASVASNLFWGWLSNKLDF